MLKRDSMKSSFFKNLLVFALVNLSGVTTHFSSAQSFIQQAKLIGAGFVGLSDQGASVSLSSDGNTLAIGGPDNIYNDIYVGATWIFTRSGTTWTQQAKLVGTDAIGYSTQGYSISLSKDGNTLAVGGPYDNNLIGATWIFTRSGTTWTQQAKLVGDCSAQGWSVSLSSDGNTLAVGGPYDDGGMGSVLIFTRSGTTWTQQTKLVGSLSLGSPEQGRSVSLSSDGNTLAIGGPYDNNNIGAVWMFRRSGTTWTQQAKLVGINNIGTSWQGLVSITLF